MIVGRHCVLHSEIVILYAVVADINDDKEILAADSGLDESLAVTRRKTGAFALNEEGIDIYAALSCPVNEVIVDLLTKLGNAVHSDDTDRCNI